MSENKAIAAIKKLLEQANANEYRDALTEMFEGWLTSPDTNGTDHISRSEKLVLYKELDAFFIEIGG